MGAAPGHSRGDPAADALGELRALLFGVEARRIDGVETQLRALAESRLARADLKAATAKVLAEALREAEVSDHRALADALAPLIVRAIQAEIRNSRDAMVEALYPLVGRLVSAAVADGLRRVTEGIAEQIDALISARRWSWRMKSLATGRPVAEIAFAETQRARVSRVLCLERGSGQLIAVWPQAEVDGRSDMMSGLIAAITEFAATTFAGEGGSLRALDLGARHVLLRSSATLIVAAECDGVLRPPDEQAIDDAFLDLIARHERIREIASADLASLDAALAGAAPERKASGAAKWVVRAAAVGLAGWVAWSAGLAMLHWSRERRVEQAFASARAGDLLASAYPLRLSVDHAAGRVRLIGLAPSDAERERLLAALREPAQPYALAATVEIVPAAASVSQRFDELTRAGQAIAAQAYEADRAVAEAVTAQGAAAEKTVAAARAAQEQATHALAADLAAAKSALAAAQAESAATRDLLAQVRREMTAVQAATLSQQARLIDAVRSSSVFFILGSAELADARAADSVAGVIAGLMRETGARLRVVGHTDDSGSPAINERLGRARAEAMVQLLTKHGVAADHLVIASKRNIASNLEEGGPAAHRRVTFELAPDNEPNP